MKNSNVSSAIAAGRYGSPNHVLWGGRVNVGVQVDVCKYECMCLSTHVKARGQTMASSRAMQFVF